MAEGRTEGIPESSAGEVGQSPETSGEGLAVAQAVADRLRQRLRAAVCGRDDVIDLVLIALLADGHILLEDYPGSGKTTLAKTLGDSITDDSADDELPSFRRIQFTPDLLPSDVTGVVVFDTETNSFTFMRGPVFASVVLADEINRTSPKVQSALLEAMGEKQVTVDNRTYALDQLFFVIATQNPLDLAGTYPLPVAQLDRFLFKVRMEHISREAELDVLSSYPVQRPDLAAPLPRVSRLEVIAARQAIQHGIALVPPVRECLVDVARALRADRRVVQGASTRALVLWMPALQAHALLQGRDYVSADDVARLAPFIFGHRIEVVPGVDDPRAVVEECCKEPLEALARYVLKRGG
jgi:MoxR-like ATPase